MKRTAFLFILFLLIMNYGLEAQEATLSSGGEAQGSTGTVSYSVGQTAFGYTEDTGGSLNAGVQQTYEITTGEEPFKPSLSLSVYPNPTRDGLNLKGENIADKDLYYELYDNQGRLLEEKVIQSNEVMIPTQKLSPATYTLRVRNKENDFQTFTIIKN